MSTNSEWKPATWRTSPYETVKPEEEAKVPVQTICVCGKPYWASKIVEDHADRCVVAAAERLLGVVRL